MTGRILNSSENYRSSQPSKTRELALLNQLYNSSQYHQMVLRYSMPPCMNIKVKGPLEMFLNLHLLL